MEFYEVWIKGLAVATLIFASPLILAALGGLFSERSGIVNIGLEGMMTAGAFFAVYGSATGGNWVFGVVLAILAGAALGLIHAVATITFQADQIVSGTAVILIAAGLVNFLNLTLFGPEGSPSDLSIPPRIAGVSSLVPLAFIAVAVSVFVIFRTPFGLRLRSVGEHPRAADTVGINVYRMRYIAVLISGALAGLAGALISFNVSSYTENMVAGNGFIALAALIFGKWKPVPVMLACLLFGFSQGLASRLGGVGWLPEALKSPELLNSLPYVITLIAIAGFVGKSVAPAAVGKPYVKH
ncbi:MAG: transporter permease [Thermoleophilia bacterium]|nr:transporter permease [Thermoleophilia bacterium]MCZ4496930.1 transporter permease [Thermoleophilia bacterium]